MKKKVLVSHGWADSDIPHLNDFVVDLENRGLEVVLCPQKTKLYVDDLKKWLPGCFAHICGGDEWTAEAMDALPEMKVISRIGVGFDTVDVKAATERHIAVTTTPGAGAGAVSEWAFTMMMALARQVIPNEKVARAPAPSGKWDIVVGSSVYGKTLGIVGLGLIGKQLSVWGKGFGMNVIAYDPVPDVAYAANNNIRLVSFDELVKTSDFISLHLPLMPSTVNLFNKKSLSMMKKTAYIINASRGGIINEADLYEALKNHVIAGAALDVFTCEPIKLDNPLLTLDNLLVAPHAAGSTYEGLDGIVGAAFRNVGDIAEGRVPLGTRNPSVFY